MNAPYDPARIGFRPLTDADLPLLHRWLHAPHVHEWWGEGQPPPPYETVVREYSPRILLAEPTYPYVMLLDDAPVGYIQAYRIADHPEYAAQIGVGDDTGVVGIDLFIGEAAHLHRGLGPLLLRAFLRDVVFGAMGATLCVIGPDETNAAAIRAYEKVGFRHWKTVPVAEEPAPEYLMTITPTALGD